MKAQRVQPTGDHEHEPVHGLPEALPPGEHMLWQGAPDWRALAVQAFHVRKVALYFGVLIAWRFAVVYGDAGVGAALTSIAWALPLAATGLALLAALAWLTARTTVYTLTERRLVLRIGIVLTVTFNLPLARVAAAALRQRGATGDITLTLSGRERIAWLHLWPHARPWVLTQPQPMLRALPDAAIVARALAVALQASLAAGESATAAAPAAAPAGRAPGTPPRTAAA
jgi:hypothetical protein